MNTVALWIFGVSLIALGIQLCRPQGRKAFGKILDKLTELAWRLRWAPRQLANKIKRMRYGVDTAYRRRAKGGQEVVYIDQFPGDTDDEKVAALFAHAQATRDHGVTLILERSLYLTQPFDIPAGVTHFFLSGGGHAIHCGGSDSGWQPLKYDDDGSPKLPRFDGTD